MAQVEQIRVKCNECKKEYEKNSKSQIIHDLGCKCVEYTKPELNTRMKINETRERLIKTIEENFPNKSFTLIIALAVKVQLLIEDITQPFALMIMGKPSGNKTTILEIINSTPDNYRSDKFTPKSFVSNSANVKKDELKSIDLLPRIRHRTLITPELSTLFADNEDSLKDNFGTLTRILDGQGFTTDTGAHGQRGYVGDYYFMWLGAIVEVPHVVWKVLGNLGPRIYFTRIPEKERGDTKTRLLNNIKEKDYSKKMEDCKFDMCEFWKYIDSQDKIKWDKINDSQDTLNKIIDCAILLSKLRASVPSWHTDGQTGTNYNFERPIIEDPSRASSALYNLARGHAVLYGRNHIENDDLKVVFNVAINSAKRDRVDLFKLLLSKERITVEELVEFSKVSPPTARKNMRMMELLELVEFEKESATTKPMSVIKLKDTFKWFLTNEAKELLAEMEFEK